MVTGFMVNGLKSRAQGLGFRVEMVFLFGYRVEGLGLRVQV